MFITKQKIEVNVLFDTVRIAIVCDDPYTAQVLFDDLVQRLKAGESIAFTGNPKVTQES